MLRGKWERHTPVDDVDKTKRPATLGTRRPVDVQQPIERQENKSVRNNGRKEDVMWGRRAPSADSGVSSAGSESSGRIVSASIMQQDADWWTKNLLDRRTGRTTDQKILYDSEGDNRGVCRYALLEKECPRGKDCHYSHPVPLATNAKMGKDLCYGMFRLGLRYNFGIGDTALIQVLDVISPTNFSVWILEENVGLDELYGAVPCSSDGKAALLPSGFVDLLDEMGVFYGGSTSQNLSYRSLRDIPDSFVAVQQLYRGRQCWFRGIVVQYSDTSDSGHPALLVRLADLGRTVSVHQVQLLRRLHQNFLHQPWFSLSIGLGGLDFGSAVSGDSMLTWLKRRLAGKLALVKVLERDPVDDRPLVELTLPVESDGRQSGSLNDEFVEMTFATRRAPVVAAEVYDYEDSDDEGDFEEPLIVPG